MTATVASLVSEVQIDNFDASNVDYEIAAGLTVLTEIQKKAISKTIWDLILKNK